MYNIIRELELLHADAKKNPELRAKLLETRFAKDPMDAFCIVANNAGHTISLGELFEFGQSYCDNLCKSTNGGNPRPNECFDDTLDTFLASL